MIRFTSFLGVGVAGATALLAAACTGNPPPGDSAYKTGSLGNGGFVFACSDGVACSEFSTGDAKDFPKNGVALGSTFNISFVPNDAMNASAINGTPADDKDIAVSGLGPFFSGGPDGILASDREGYGAIVAEHANGVVVDFVNVRIAKPSNLEIYETTSIFGNAAKDVGASLTLKVGDTKRLRTVAMDAASNVLAGSLRSEWSSNAENVFRVSVTNGVATVQALAAGSAVLSVTGGTFTRTVPVTVTP